jgi:hypothetical protein
VRAGLFADPIFLRFGELSSQPRSAEAILKEGLGASPTAKRPATTSPAEHAASNWRSDYGATSIAPEFLEHLSLISRWFYSKPREGEIFFREDDWPYRRILRACSRVLTSSGSAPPDPNAPSTR